MRANAGYLSDTGVPFNLGAPPREGTTDLSGTIGAESASSNPSADAAMDRYAAGSEEAFAELYDALCPRLYRYALRLAKHRARAEDLVQQTLERLLARRGQFVRGSLVTPWAIAILRHQFLDQERRPKLEIHWDDDSHDEHLSQRPDPHMCVETMELEQQLRHALSDLPSAQLEAFELVHYADMSHAEAAEVLDTTVASIKSRLQRAHSVLRERLKSPDHESREIT